LIGYFRPRIVGFWVYEFQSPRVVGQVGKLYYYYHEKF
jgi:hypothetical protein